MFKAFLVVVALLVPASALADGSAASQLNATTQFSLAPQQAFAAVGQAYVATTKFLTVPAGDTANITVCNQGTTKSLYIYRRRFDAQVPTATTPLTYGGIASPPAISSSSTYSSATAATTTAGNNALAGAAASPNMQMTYAVGTAVLSGTVTAQSTIATGGLESVVDEPKIIPPGVCFGQFVTIPSSLTSGSFVVGLTIFWWEQ